VAREQRKLAAIVAADVVGYSRLMGRDESGTLARLRKNRSEHLDPVLRKYGGRLVKLTGDGVLVEFASAVDALSATIEFQQAMVEANRGQPADMVLVFRMGLHLGDLIVEGDDLYGDGVNVAARLEAEATAGGIVISRTVHEAVAGRLHATFDDLGHLELKNIERPVHAFSVKWQPEDWQLSAVPNASVAAPAASHRPLPLPDKPSIAVLPFQNMSGDPEQEYFADGMVEEIITALSRFRSLFVIARNSSFTYKGRAVDVKQVGRELGVRYVMEGSVRKAASRLRVAAQLIDAMTGAHIWAERFDGAREDIFDLQDQVTEKVVAAIAPNVERVEIARAKRKPSSSLDAYEYYLRGLAFWTPPTRDSVDQAQTMFHRAIELDPEFAAAYGAAAWCYTIRKGYGWNAGTAEEKTEVSRLARATVRLGQDDAMTLAYAAYAYAYVIHDLQTAKAVIDQALVLNPNVAAAWAVSGWVNVWLGDATIALEHLQRAMRLSPLDLAANTMRNAMAHACFYLGRYQEAFRWADVNLRDRPDSHTALRIAAASAAFAGLSDVAQRMGERLLAAHPEFRISALKGILGPYQNLAFIDKYAEGLRKAGLPE
jgi:TolB-like protein/class 3 adenylate cyclase/Tfp pilus assembly protein PilF